MSDTKQITAMLKQLGWGSGFRLPISNDENRKLEQLLEQNQSKLVNLSLELQEVSLAVDNSANFMKNLNAKMRHAKDVETAKRGQMEKERQFLSLAERDHAKTEHDVKNMEKRIRGVRERNKQLEATVLRRKDALGELVDVINFDKKAISAYEEKFSKEDAYLKLIEDFADTDNEKLRKCQDDYQQMGEKVATSRVRLDQTVCETEIMEGELEALAKRFRRAHAERNQFIENWKKTLEVLEDRDQEIMEISNDYRMAALQMKKKLCMLERQEAFYDNIKAQSKSYALELRQLERNMNICHRKKTELESEIDDNADGITELVNYITLTDKEIKRVQAKLKELNEESDDWREKMLHLRDELEKLKAKYDVVTMESMTSNEQIKQLQEFLDNEEKKVETLLREYSKQIGYKSQRENQLKEIGQQVMVKESEVKNLKSAINRVRKQCTETSDYLVKTQTAAYRMDLRAMDLSVKIHELQNPTSKYTRDEYAQYKQKVADLKEGIETQLLTQKHLKAQISHCDHVTTICQKEVKKETEQFQNFEITTHKLETEMEMIAKEDEVLFENIKDVGVNNALLRVQLHRNLQAIKGYQTKMFDLEQHRITIQSAVKERKRDIQTYTALLQSKKRSLQDESQKLKGKCYEVTIDVQARKRKYEMVMAQMWVGVEKDGQSNEDLTKQDGRSEAYYIIKLAQEREHYRQEGDKWDERVKEAEKIVEGLQNTLALMLGTNEAFKDSLKPATDTTDEGQKLKELKQRELESVRKLKMAKDEREKCFHTLRQRQFDLDKLVSRRAEYEHEIMEKQFELQGIIIEINGQKEKIQRATQQANKLVRELSKLEALDVELLQNDLRLRVTKEKYEFAVLTLEKLLQANPNLLGETLDFLRSKGMDSLEARLERRLISPSMTSTPYQSGRSTPHGHSVGNRQKGKSAVRISSAIGAQSTVMERRSIHKSVVFETLTSAPSAKRMLDNISRGLEANRGAAAVGPEPVQTLEEEGSEGGISFGELRQALRNAIEEQKKTSEELYTVEEEGESEAKSKRPKDVRKSKLTVPKADEERVADSVVDILVDNREQFDDPHRDEHEQPK